MDYIWRNQSKPATSDWVPKDCDRCGTEVERVVEQVTANISHVHYKCKCVKRWSMFRPLDWPLHWYPHPDEGGREE